MHPALNGIAIDQSEDKAKLADLSAGVYPSSLHPLLFAYRSAHKRT
jgi:hypothetical protein